MSKDFVLKYLTKLFFFFCLTFSVVASYLCGYQLDSIQRFERFLYVDNLENNNYSNYLHGNLQIDSQHTLDYFQAVYLQTPSRYKGPSYFMVGSGQPVAFQSSLSDFSIDDVFLGGVTAYSDSDIMETIPLPLYRDIGFAFQTQKSGYIPCYISNVMAHKIIEERPDFNNLDDFFTKEFTFEIFEDDNVTKKFVVVNIYLVDNEFGDWPEQQYNDYTSQYSAYNAHFNNCHNNFIFISSTAFYSKYGISFYFDLKNNFAFIRNYYSKILGYDFKDNGYDPQIYITDIYGELKNVSDEVNVNKYCNSENLLSGASVLTISLLFISYIFLILSSYFIRKQIWQLRHPFTASFFVSFLPFILLQFFSYFAKGFSNYLVLNLIFNAFGNGAFIIISTMLFLIFTLRFKGKQDEQ